MGPEVQSNHQHDITQLHSVIFVQSHETDEASKSTCCSSSAHGCKTQAARHMKNDEASYYSNCVWLQDQ